MTARYVIRCKTDGKYYRSARAKHLYDNWVDDFQQATVLYSDAVFSRFADNNYEKVYIKLVELKECMSAWKDEPQPETTLTTTDHSCDCRGCKYVALESVDEPCCNCSDSDKYEKSEEHWYVILNMNMQYEICRKCPKSGLFSGTYEECEKWILDKENEEQEEKHYKPFEDTAELMLHYQKHFHVEYPPFYEPLIWVKHKTSDSRYLITSYDELCVNVEDIWLDMKDLFEKYVFLDNSTCGVLIDE